LAAEGFDKSQNDAVDWLIVDRQLPKGKGLDVIVRLREQGRSTLVLVWSTRGSLDDRVGGLNAGGEGYLPKSFALVEPVASVEAPLRRPNETRDARTC